MQSRDFKCNIFVSLVPSLVLLVLIKLVSNDWVTIFTREIGSQWEHCETVRTVWDSERMLPEHCQSSEKGNGNMTNISTPTGHIKQNSKSSPHHHPHLTSHQTSEYYIYWHLHDFLRRWDLMSLFEFFEGTKIQVKLSGSAPWGIQSLCLTYNAISEKMFFKESAQTIQRLRVRLTVRPP